MTAAIDFLTKAAALMAERGKQYDQPAGERSMGKAVAAFNVITGQSISEAEGWLLLQILKDVRQWQRPTYHADSAEDCVAYAALKAEALAGSAGIPVDLEPAVLANVAAFNGDWPDETRRQDAAAEDEAFAAIQQRASGQKSGIPNYPREAVGAAVAFPEERGLYFAATPGEMEDGA